MNAAQKEVGFELRQLSGEIVRLTKKIETTPPFALKPIVSQLLDKQARFNALLADLFCMEV